MALVAPSILSADFADLADEVKRITEAGADYVPGTGKAGFSSFFIADSHSHEASFPPAATREYPA